MANNILLRQGKGDMMNRKLEELYNATVNDFGKVNISGFTKSNSEIIAGARKVITGINVAQYLMVEPIITNLLEVLPKPIAKETFEKICLDIGTNIERFYEPGEANNVLETAVHHNREILRKLGIPERNFHKYGAEWPEEVYTISKGAGNK
ncbi:MAG: hypothetical protein IKU42_05965 [Oscillospiraceae bacterium]|nr:hypothetical protein [Oscillospiraceae bacterium]